MGCIFCKLRPKAATMLTDSSLRLRTSCCNRFLYLDNTGLSTSGIDAVAKKYLVEIWSGNVCRQRPRTCRASRTVCRTYRTQSGKTPPKWNRTAAQKSSELSHSKLPESLWSLKIFLISPSFPDFRMPKSSSALISHMQRKCTFWKSSSKNKPPMRMNPNDTSSF